MPSLNLRPAFGLLLSLAWLCPCSAQETASPKKDESASMSPEFLRQIKEEGLARADEIGLATPVYTLRAAKASELEKLPQAKAYFKIQLVFGKEPMDLDYTAASRMLDEAWPGVPAKEIQPVVAWVVRDRIVGVQPVSRRPLDLTKAAVFDLTLPLNAEMAEGHPLLFLLGRDGFIKVDARKREQTIDKAIRAVVADNDEALEALLQAGLDPKTRDSAKRSLASYAAEAGSLRCLGVLKQHEVKFAEDDERKPSPLEYACSKGRENAVVFLLANKVRASGRSQHEASPLHRAASNGFGGIVKILLDKGANADEVTASNEMALFAAVNAGYPEVAELLFDKSYRGDFSSRNNSLSMLPWCRSGNLAMVKFFVDKGADASVTNDNQSTLCEAAIKGSAELAELLIKAKAKVNWQSKDGMSALMVAARGNLSFLKALLAAKADPNLKSDQGSTALHIAIMNQKPEIVAELLQGGAASDVRTKQGYTPLQIALRLGDKEIVDELQKAGAKLDPADPKRAEDLEALLSLDEAELLSAQLKAGLAPTFELPGGWSLRRVAGFFKAKDCVALLESSGAKLDETSPVALVKPTALSEKPSMVSFAKPSDPRPIESNHPASTVRVVFLVDSDGSVRFPSIDEGTEGILRLAVLETCRTWKLSKPVCDGKPVAFIGAQSFTFASAKERRPAPMVFDVPPKPIKQVKPIYPFDQRRARETATVTVAFVVTKEGTVKEAKVLKTSGEPFNEPALECVRQWRFKPALYKGQPVEAALQVPIMFSITER